MKRQTWIVCDSSENELFRGGKIAAHKFYKSKGGLRCGLSIGYLLMEKDSQGNWIDY